MDPYNTPQSAVLQEGAEIDYQAIEFSRLKKLYYRSVNLNVIAFLWLLGLGITLIMVAYSLLGSVAIGGPEIIIMAILTVPFGIAAFGLYKRENWGRILGIIGCFFTLLSIPIGTIIGICGLFALFGSPELFGSSKLKHKELKLAFKAAKKK